MKTDAALSWKGLSLSAILHGTFFAAAGALLISPAEVGTQEAPVTAEFQILPEASPSCAVPPERNADPSKPDTDFSPSESAGQFASENEESVENALPLPVAKEITPHDPMPAGSPAASSSRPSRRASPWVSHPATVAVAKRGARNLLPDYLENPPPRYPESSRLAGEQGVAMVRAEVASSGEVLSVSLARSSGHEALDRAAVEAVSPWKFRPASAAGIAMASEVTVPVRFELRQAQEPSIRNP